VPASKNLIRALCIAVLLNHSGLVYPAASVRWVEVAEYQIDMTLTPRSQANETLSNLKHQIGIVDSLQLPSQIQSFFRSVKIVIDPSLTGMNGQNTQIDGKWVIRARPGQWPSDRAILLHELLHAYQREALGRPTPPIGRAFQEALRVGTYPSEYKDAYFLSNAAEYFAVIGEIYLSGPTFRPPYNCGNVQKAQPEFIMYLATLFGGRECR
jgi:hypothetical protein